MTQYIILKRHDSLAGNGELISEPDWQVWKEGIEARSGEAAIRQAIDGEAQEGTYVAVPSRSWEPKSVKVETRITLT